MRHEDEAPAFYGNPEELLKFFEDVEFLAEEVESSDREMMVWACRYTENWRDEELWKTSDAFN